MILYPWASRTAESGKEKGGDYTGWCRLPSEWAAVCRLHVAPAAALAGRLHCHMMGHGLEFTPAGSTATATRTNPGADSVIEETGLRSRACGKLCSRVTASHFTQRRCSGRVWCVTTSEWTGHLLREERWRSTDSEELTF